MSRQTQIVQAVDVWPGIHSAPHRFGGVEFMLGTREIGHVHGSYLVDITFTNAIRAQLIAEGKADHHHIYPNTGLISFHLNADGDVEHALWLLRLSYLRTLALLRRRGLADPATSGLQIETELAKLAPGDELKSLIITAHDAEDAESGA